MKGILLNILCILLFVKSIILPLRCAGPRVFKKSRQELTRSHHFHYKYVIIMFAYFTLFNILSC